MPKLDYRIFDQHRDQRLIFNDQEFFTENASPANPIQIPLGGIRSDTQGDKDIPGIRPAGGALLNKSAILITTLLGHPAAGMDGKRFRDILSMSGRILYETNLAPLLRLQQVISEVTLDLKRANGVVIPVIMAASSVSNG